MLQPNTLIQDRYRIVRTIEQEPTAETYEAIDHYQRRTVVLKRLCAEHTLHEQDARHMRETYDQVMPRWARLKHNGVPTVHTFFANAAGLFIVLEHTPGDHLAAQLAQRGTPFALDNVLHWAAEILDILDYLQQQTPPLWWGGITPYRLKRTDEGKVMLSNGDFVTSNIAYQGALQSPRLCYLSLEQIQGEAWNLASELYSLAATLYHLITSTPPTPALWRAASIAQQHPDPLRPLDKAAPQVPAMLAAVLMQTLALNPTERPATISDIYRILKPTEQSIATASDKTVCDLPTESERVLPRLLLGKGMLRRAMVVF
jgi:eukaryotic-like serine/threonine-protein kinase